MNKETYTTWYNGLKERLAAGHINQEHYETLIVDNLSSLIMHFFDTRYDDDHITLEEHLALVNHYFELVADAEISERTAMLMVRSVVSSIQKLPAAKAFAEKHNTPVPSVKEILGNRPALLRKHITNNATPMIGRPVITPRPTADAELEVSLPWKLALGIYQRQLVEVLMESHGFDVDKALEFIAKHQDKHNELLAQALNDIISREANTKITVSGITKPEE